jgi:hypothetical protein
MNPNKAAVFKTNVLVSIFLISNQGIQINRDNSMDNFLIQGVSNHFALL